MLKMGPIQFLYNSKFDFTAKSLVTDIVVITRALCINISYSLLAIQVTNNLCYGTNIKISSAYNKFIVLA